MQPDQLKLMFGSLFLVIVFVLWHTAGTMIDEPVPSHDVAHIPRGVADYFWQEAYDRRALEAELLETFRRWGYGDVILPMFEFADMLNARASDKLRAQMVRFSDRDGSMLALRPDMTIGVARLVGTRLHDWPMPQRFCYAGSVFRHVETQGGRQREFRQAGVELIGSDAPQADAEVLALTVKAMQAAGLSQFRLVVGQLLYFTGLLQDLDLEPPQREALLHAIDRNSAPALAAFLRDVPLRTQQRRTVEEIPLLSGGEPQAVIDRADRLCLNYTMHAALENLRAIFEGLAVHGVVDHVYLDLTEINDLGYYTGLTFEALTPGQGFSVAGGGRYDHLSATFGAEHPAVGVALGVDRLLLAARTQRGARDVPMPRAPHLAVAAGDDAACMVLVEQFRAAGLRVAVDVCGRDVGLQWAEARSAAIPRLLIWRDGGFDLHEDDATAGHRRRLTPEQALNECAGWKS